VLAVLAVLLCVGTAFASDDIRFSARFDQAAWEAYKLANQTFGSKPTGEKVGGDNVGNATFIPGLPYSDFGNTGGFADDYCGSCIYCGGAPDVVYAYTPTADVEAVVSLCGSGYDTGLYIYQNAAGNEVACNDDYCGLQSQVQLYMYAGNTYYIVIDGYSSSYGDYTLLVEEYVPPEPGECPCPPGAPQEGEVDCYNDYDDQYNGGCNSTPAVFTDVMACDHYICGNTGVYDFGGVTYRDTDWYRIYLPVDAPNFTVTVWSPVPMAIFFLSGACPSPVVDYSAYGIGDCVEVSLSAPMLAGEHWIFVSTDGWTTDWVCGNRYTMLVSGTNMGPSGSEPTTWGSLRSLYR
jgi:hypothetical protein